MGFWRRVGEIAGTAVGVAIGGPVKVIGMATGSTFIEEVGDGAMQATRRTGEVLGEATEGVVTIADGLISSDENRVQQGLRQTGRAVGDVAVGAGRAVVHVGKSAGQTVSGLMAGDMESAKSGARELAKVAAVGVLSVGVVDFVVDDVGDSAAGGPEGHHFVDPHEVDSYVRADGTHVDGYWRDGDGNTAIDKTADEGGGYWRADPRKA